MITKQQYVEYLICTIGNFTGTNLAEHLDDVSHDTITDYLQAERLTAHGLWELAGGLIEDSPEAFMIVDDSVQDKRYSRFIELVKLQYSGAEHGPVRGIGVVNLVHSAGAEKDFYPIDYRIYAPVLKPEKERAQLSLLVGDEYEYFFFVTNTELPSEKVVISYEKRGNSENYIKEAKYDMAVGHLLLKSFWANEAVFQMMMLAYNLFLLFKFDSLSISEYRQQIKTFRLKYIFLAAKIIRTARYVVMKLSAKYPYKDVYENCLS